MTEVFDRNFLDPYIIAEIGVNHEGSLARAKEMISSVARAGGHAAKFQTYRASTLASATSSPAYWDRSKENTPSQFELFARYDSFGPDEYRYLADHCREVGIDFMSTPFDFDAIQQLDAIVRVFKVASADLTNVPLLRRVAATGKPVILSVGASTLDEIRTAIAQLQGAGAGRIGLMHCMLRYPTPPELANVSAITTMIREFGEVATIGYSDHVPPSADGTVPALVLGATLGARIIEKHFTDDRARVGNDHYHAFDEDGLRGYVKYLSELRLLAGDGDVDVATQQDAINNARRRIFFASDLDAGTTITEEDLIPLRANVGWQVARWDEVVGSELMVAKRAREPLLDGDI